MLNININIHDSFLEARNPTQSVSINYLFLKSFQTIKNVLSA